MEKNKIKKEVMKAKSEVSKNCFNKVFVTINYWRWVMENILGFSKSEIKLLLKQKSQEGNILIKY